MKKCITAILVASATSSVAFGQNTAGTENWYFGASYAQMDYEEDFLDETLEFDLGALLFRGGYQFNEVVSLEARVGMGVGDDSDEIEYFGFKFDTDVELNKLYGMYARFGIPTDTIVYPYFIVGFTEIDLEVGVSGAGVSVTDSESDGDVTYGFGLDINLGDSFGLFVEYMNWYDKDEAEISGFNFGGKFRF